MKARILLINPPIYDFTAYDFWLKPYGLLRVAGFLRGRADFSLFDYLDRLDPRVPDGRYRSDRWGRGEFYSEPQAKPALFAAIPRRYRRFGLPRNEFHKYLRAERPFDFAFVQSGMTYWYPGLREVIEDLRALSPRSKIIVGGVYATLCPAHARSLGVDLIVEGQELAPVWRYLGVTPNESHLPLWDLYPNLNTGVLKLADGCPFRCTYCSVPQVYPKFHGHPVERSLTELEFLLRLGVKQVAFYDDALLYRAEEILKPFLCEVLRRRLQVNFHTPNALNARFINAALARLMVDAGFKNVYLGFESSAYTWQKKTGGKVYSDELVKAVDNLVNAGADPARLHAYLIVGHPNADEQSLVNSMYFAHNLGIRVMLSEFSPIPGTRDGEICRGWLDLDEPLWHNKNAFVIKRLGFGEISRLKNLAAGLNQRLRTATMEAVGAVGTKTPPIYSQGAQVIVPTAPKSGTFP